MRKTIFKRLLFLVVGFISLISLPAWSAVTSVTGTKTLVSFGGKDYIKFQGFMNVTVPSNGDLSKFPITIFYPKKANQFNGTAIVIPRCYTMQELSYMDFAGEAMTTLNCGTKLFTERFLGGRGYIYVDLSWNKYVLDSAALMGQPIEGYHYDDIKNSMDVHQALADLPSLLETPPSGLCDMPSAKIAIASAISNGNGILREYFLHQANNYPHTSNYDGYLQVGLGPSCTDMHFNTMNDPLSAFPFCAEPISESPAAGKVIVINTETDLQIFGGGFMRLEGPNFRFYEVPGAHIPKPLLDIRVLFPDIPPPINFRQNIANTFKTVPAMVENLRQWIKEGVLPPPSVALNGWSPEGLFYTGTPCASLLGDPLAGAPYCTHFGNSPLFPLYGGFDGGIEPVSQLARDSYGNATGGIRLPYIEVPLGEYNGLELGLCNQEECNEKAGGSFQLNPQLHPEWERILGWEAAGFFNRFDDEVLNRLYPNKKIYVTKIAGAALNALLNRWILPEDYLDYVKTAMNSVIGTQASYSAADLEAAH